MGATLRVSEHLSANVFLGPSGTGPSSAGFLRPYAWSSLRARCARVVPQSVEQTRDQGIVTCIDQTAYRVPTQRIGKRVLRFWRTIVAGVDPAAARSCVRMIKVRLSLSPGLYKILPPVSTIHLLRGPQKVESTWAVLKKRYSERNIKSRHKICYPCSMTTLAKIVRSVRPARVFLCVCPCSRLPVCRSPCWCVCAPLSVDQVYGGTDRPPPPPLSWSGASSSQTHKTQFRTVTPGLEVTPAVNRCLSVPQLHGVPYGLTSSPVPGTLLGIPELPATSTRFGFVSSLLPSTSEPLPKRQFLFPPPPKGWKYLVQVVMADAAEGGPNAVSGEQCSLGPCTSDRHSGKTVGDSLDTVDGQGSGSDTPAPLRMDCSVHIQRAVTKVILRLPIHN